MEVLLRTEGWDETSWQWYTRIELRAVASQNQNLMTFTLRITDVVNREGGVAMVGKLETAAAISWGAAHPRDWLTLEELDRHLLDLSCRVRPLFLLVFIVVILQVCRVIVRE
jgi:hypothetical protein